MKWALGIDIGGTKIDIASVNTLGKVFQHRRLPFKQGKAPEIALKEISNEIVALLKHENEPPSGIGIGIAGQVNINTGMLFFATNLQWENVNIKTFFERALSIKTYVTNDVRAATLGEWKYGAGSNFTDFVCLFIGTGVGGGIVSQNNLIRGYDNCAGEIGHMIIDKNGPHCSCGNKGCLEAFAGGFSIAKRFGTDSAKTVIEAYRQGDSHARIVIEDAKAALIAGGISIAHMLNPQAIILGGGIFKGLPEIQEWLYKGITKNAFSAATNNFQVCSSSLGDLSVAIGAAGLVFQS